MLMALHRAAVHAKTFSTCAARRHTSSHHNLSPSLVHASVRATKRCSSNPQYLGSPTTPHTCGIRTAPSPATTAQRSARRSPDTTQILESSRRRTVSNRASASGTTAAEVSSTQLTDADPEELSSDSQGEPASDARLDPGLYLVATPIGNLEDITLRAVRILRCADRILAEDTRHTRKLLNHLGIRTPLSSFHEHNERGKQSQVLQQLGLGAALALVSDAGMPAISDPGALLVAAAAAAGHRVIPIPGPSAVLAALIASGLSTENFMFVGFLPAKASARKERLLELFEVRATLIAYVPPHSLAAVLESAAAVLGPERRCVVARELTKLHEELFRTTLGGAAKHYSLNAPRGEITLVIEGAAEGGPESHTEEDLIASLQQAFLDGHSTSSAVRVVRESTGAPKRNLYRLAVQLAELQGQPQEELEGTPSD